jgi:hypothetical protein
LNGSKAGEKANMTLRPDSIRATRCYLGRGADGNFFGGSIGRFMVHSVALVDSEPPSPDPAAFELAPMFVAPCSLVMSSKVGSDPLGVVEYWFEEEGGRWNSGWTAEPRVQLNKRDASRPLLYRVKMRDKSGNETKFSGPTRAGGFPKDTRILVVSPGTPAVLEAESYFASVPSGDGSMTWEKRGDVTGFVGTGYMAVPDRGKANDPFDAAAARLDYAMNFTKPGRYYLWLRASGNNDGGASIHAGIGLQTEEWGLRIHTGHGRFAWTRSPAFTIAKPGNHLFSIWMHEDGAMMDRLVLTSDKNYEPSPEERADDQVMIGEGSPEGPSIRVER